MNSMNSNIKPNSTSTTLKHKLSDNAWRLLGIVAVSIVWVIAATSVASRIHFVMGYGTLPSGPAWLEPFLASYSAWAFAVGAMLCWGSLASVLLLRPRSTIASHTVLGWAMVSLLASALVPLSLAIWRENFGAPAANYWEPLWLSCWSGLSFAWLAQNSVDAHSARFASGRWGVMLMVAIVCMATIGWTWQTILYYNNFMLGFNDFGHFAQRVANTSIGNGILVESPVLPSFWDHFNPGLLLLVPLWKVFPTVVLVFVLQALSLASGAFCVWGIAKQQGLGTLAALLFGLAWLAQPVLGQMNLAYTYGWHPISLAIPLLLAGLWALLAHRLRLALGLVVLAMSMEEGVIVVVCLFCAVCAAQGFWPLKGEQGQRADGSDDRPASATFDVPTAAWIVLAVACGASFVLVYKLSGLAEFQTARFVSLGSSAWEVLLSPLLRPAAFWGSLFRWEKLYFVLSLWLPCFIPSLFRGWRILLATVLPLLVLVVWDHRPATSLAFHYASTLLPIFWLATILGTRSGATEPKKRLDPQNLEVNIEQLQNQAVGMSTGALATGLILSLFVGQLPYSSPTLWDVTGVTYGTEGAELRRSFDADGNWLAAQVQQIHSDGSPVLATGRIAAHLVGNVDVETVGQYLLRRPQLAVLPDRLGEPITHYRWVILDRREGFQQNATEIAAVEVEAQQAGFNVVAEQFDIVVMQR